MKTTSPSKLKQDFFAEQGAKIKMNENGADIQPVVELNKHNWCAFNFYVVIGIFLFSFTRHLNGFDWMAISVYMGAMYSRVRAIGGKCKIVSVSQLSHNTFLIINCINHHHLRPFLFLIFSYNFFIPFRREFSFVSFVASSFVCNYVLDEVPTAKIRAREKINIMTCDNYAGDLALKRAWVTNYSNEHILTCWLRTHAREQFQVKKVQKIKWKGTK